MIYFDNDEFEKIMPKIERIMEVEEVTTHTDVFYKLLEFYFSFSNIFLNDEKFVNSQLFLFISVIKSTNF